MEKLFWFIVHSFKECDEEDLTWYKNKKSECKKCGRITYHFSKY